MKKRTIHINHLTRIIQINELAPFQMRKSISLYAGLLNDEDLFIGRYRTAFNKYGQSEIFYLGKRCEFPSLNYGTLLHYHRLDITAYVNTLFRYCLEKYLP